MKLLLTNFVHRCVAVAINHKLVSNDKGLLSFFTVSYKDMKKTITCFLNERIEICNIYKKCIDCQNILFLYSQFNDYYLNNY